jgi:hypothetical protein
MQLDLAALDLPFTEEEVWNMIKELPSDKSPAPDGMTGAFYKSAWSVIKGDVLRAVNAFYCPDRRQFYYLNAALLTLIPKKPDAVKPSDYRPISLIHSFPKLISKMLANRLSPKLDDLVQRNRSAFIKGRCIQDNYKYVQCAAKLLKARKIPKMLLKLNISKAFDTVDWPFLLELLRAWGFGRRWRDWISLLLSTASTRVLLNGRPGKPIDHRRGLRQGNPLSPMLFILVMDTLSRLFGKASEQGLLQPIGHPTIKFQCSLYADDVILFASPTVLEARVIARIMTIFGDASGLKTNLSKCSITPIHGAHELLNELQEVLHCQISQFPITYLGIPLSTGPILRSYIRPIIDKVTVKLPGWKGPLMPKSGQLVLTKAVLSMMPTYTLMAAQLPAWAIEGIDKIRRRFVWTGGDASVRRKMLGSLEISLHTNGQGRTRCH